MRDVGQTNWQRWRIARTPSPTGAESPRGATPSPLAQRSISVPVPIVAEEPGPDGIRWNLVRRIQAEIAAGTYDDDERWAQAHAKLLRTIEADA